MTSASESISAMSGRPSGSGFGRAQRLDGAHEVVAEEADRAARERRRVAHRRLAEAPDVRRGERVGISLAPSARASGSDQRSTERGRKPMND